MVGCRCRGKFVTPGKFFPPPYYHNVTNANPNPNLNPRPNPNPNLNPTPNPNPKFNPIFNFNLNLYCCVGIIFQCNEFSTTPDLQ